MLTTLYIVFVAAFAYLTWQSVGVYQSKRSSYALLLLIVLAGLAYDTLIILLGRFIGEGDLLKTLNAGRYLVHGLATPAMIIFGFGIYCVDLIIRGALGGLTNVLSWFGV